MNAVKDDASVSRRKALAGAAGAFSAGMLIAPSASAAAPPATARAADVTATGLPVLAVGQNWQQVLATTRRVQLEPGATYVLPATVELPDDCLVVGNGATVTVTGPSVTALRVTQKRNVTVTGVRFRGQEADPLGTSMAANHVAVRITRGSDVRVTDCDFARWRGAGVVVTGSAADDYFGSRTVVSGNTFDRCYFGFSAADRSEYALLANNVFTYCRLAVWNSSGNWNIQGNTVVGCYGAYYSLAATSPYGGQSSDNWNHGAVTGSTFNHSNGGTPVRWTANLAFPVGGSPADPGPGVVVSGVLPPTFSGNTLWYTDVTATNLQGSRWVLAGCALSDLTVRCSGSAPVHLVGHQGNHAPVLTGNVVDVLAG
ncbi:right-handed parallel beta-helix repeat-containing protein [Streptomyces sp. NPDC085937]|uniref:right-handed parallel beta-helix repeat-containing protein n=1 Tax=Streptomyces sp. NPDC085937 TaxID=3365742 RepID=UPI0037D0E5F5